MDDTSRMALNSGGGDEGSDEKGEWLKTYVHDDGGGVESEESK